MDKIDIAGQVMFTTSANVGSGKAKLQVTYWVERGQLRGRLLVGKNCEAELGIPYEPLLLPDIRLLQSATRDWVTGLLKLRLPSLLFYEITFSDKD